jgi:MFS family permease
MTAGAASIVNPALARTFAVSLGSLTSLFLLASVVPSYATSVGAGTFGAGLTTGVLMFATVGAEFAAPWLAMRFGYRAALGAGLVFLGAPTLALPYASDLAGILAVSIVRGVGFAIVMVLGDALIPLLAPADRRGEALGLAGVVASVPVVVALPLGPWLADRVGYTSVFLAGGAAALLALAAVARLPEPDRRGSTTAGVLPRLRDTALLGPALVFGATAVAGGVVTTFAPLALGGIGPTVLLLQAGAAAVTRWWAGRRSDTHGVGGLLGSAVVLCALGMLGLSQTGASAAVLIGAVVFGAGFGIAQNASLAVMFAAVPRSGYGRASALWNMAFDGGYGIGAVSYGAVAGVTGYPIAFALTAGVVLIAVEPAHRRLGRRTT